MIKLSIIIPFFNEERTIRQFCIKLSQSFKDINCEYIFVDDGSNDGSLEILTNTTNKLLDKDQFKIIILDKNYGKAFAVKKGIEMVSGEYSLLIDSDLEYDPLDAYEIYQIAMNNDLIHIIQGSRYLGAKVQARKHLFNDFAVRINTFLFNFLFNQSITDLHTGTKVIKSELLKKLKLSFSRFGLEIDINSQIAKKNINIFEYGVSYIERSKSDGKKLL